MTASVAEAIRRGVALAFFASAYADQADRAGQSLTGEIMDQLPDIIDPAAERATRTLCVRLTQQHSASLDALYRWMESQPTEGADRVLSPELFGHYVAMQAMGHGVGVEAFGYAVRTRLTVPHVEQPELDRDYFNTEATP